MITLLANNKPITVQAGEKIVLQKSSTKLGEIQNRQGSYTNDFEIPASYENLKNLGYVNLMSVSDQAVDSNSRIDATLLNNKVQISRGYLQISGVDFLNNTISVAFFGGLSDWVAKLSGKSIRDIELSELNHEWTASNVSGSWANTEGYIYPLINYGNLTGFDNLSELSTTDFYPALFQSTLLQRAFNEVGYKVSGSFVDEFAYKNAIIPFAEKEFLSSEQYSDTFRGSITGNQLQQQFFSNTSSEDVVNKFTFNTASVEQNVYSSFNASAGTFEAPISDTFKLRFQLDLTQTLNIVGGTSNSLASLGFVFKDQLGTEIVKEELLSIVDTSDSISGLFVYEFEWDAAAGDKISPYLYFEFTSNTNVTSIQYISNPESYSFFCDGIDRTMEEGDLVDIAYSMPDLQVLDVIRDMIQRHGLIITVDDVTQTVNFDRFEKMLTKTAENWSQKVDISKVHALDFTTVTENYAKSNIFKYKDSESDDGALYEYDSENSQALGEGKIEIDNDFLQEENEQHTSIFKATQMTMPFNATIGLYIPEILRLDENLEPAYEPEARILYVVPDLLIDDITLTIVSSLNFEGSLITEIAYGYFYKYISQGAIRNVDDSLCFGDINNQLVEYENLIDKNYRGLKRILNEGKMIEISVQLRDHEFTALDFSTPKYIKAGFIEGLFFLDEVTEFEGDNNTCKATLIKIS